MSPNELASFFENSMNLNYSDILPISETITNFSVVSLVSSSLLRYYGAVKPYKGSSLFSFLCLTMGFNFFLFMFVLSIFKGFAIEVSAFIFHYSLIALLFIYLVISRFVERKIVEFYTKRGLVLKKHTRLPIVSYLFVFLCIAVHCTLAAELILAVAFNFSLDRSQFG